MIGSSSALIELRFAVKVKVRVRVRVRRVSAVSRASCRVNACHIHTCARRSCVGRPRDHREGVGLGSVQRRVYLLSVGIIETVCDTRSGIIFLCGFILFTVLL